MLARYSNDQQPWHVLSGPGALESLAGELDLRKKRSVLLLTTRSLVRVGGLLERVRNEIGERLVAEFAECETHVPIATVLRVRELIEQSGADVVVALGGGSVIDTAKSAALAAVTSADEAELVELARSSELGNVRPVPVIALPTALAGSEFTNVTSFVAGEARTKHMVRSPLVTCDLIVLDPILASETPEGLWVSSGLKTLSDACEQLINPAVHPLARPLLLEGVRSLFASLVSSGERDDEAVLRAYQGVWATYFATFSASGGLGPGAVIRHWLGGSKGVPHSLISSVLLSQVLDRTIRIRPEIAAELGATTEEARAALGPTIRAALSRAGLPQTLRDIGVEVDVFEDLPVDGLADVSVVGKQTTREEILAILDAAFKTPQMHKI